MAEMIDDSDAAVMALVLCQSRGGPHDDEAFLSGVELEEVDLPGLRTVDGIAEVEGNYPSSGGKGERAAWFRDSEGNLLGVGQPRR